MNFRSIVYMLLFILFAQGMTWGAQSTIEMIQYGQRNSDTITNVLTQIGTRPVELAFDGGTWSITNNVTFPTNTHINIRKGSMFNIVSNTVTINGSLDLGMYQKFSGTGVVNGTFFTGTMYSGIWFGTNSNLTVPVINTTNLSTTALSVTNLTILSTATYSMNGTNHPFGFCMVNSTQSFYYVTYSNATTYTNVLLGR